MENFDQDDLAAHVLVLHKLIDVLIVTAPPQSLDVFQKAADGFAASLLPRALPERTVRLALDLMDSKMAHVRALQEGAAAGE